ncbi:Ig-like domain-containing protein [Actinoplanes campanulatus]|nr:Ig-like domain-containing protein [Actinoplanes capillaceus]
MGTLLTPSPATAATSPSTTTVYGTFSRVVVDGDMSTPAGDHASRTVTEPVVTIDDTMVPMPAAAAVGLSPGTEVAVTVSAPAAVDTTAEVAAALETGQAKILEADPAPFAATLPPQRAGAHTLTVLPVYWTAPDSQTPATLRTAADATAAFWSEQTAGAITIPTIDVRDWTSIPNPATCDYSGIANAARAAHGVASPTSRDHVLIYFPKFTACGWAGLAYLSGGQMWINGYGSADAWEHEFGHNLGLGHANSAACKEGTTAVPLSTSCTVSSYDDYDVMGYARYRDGHNLNTALADVLGTLADPVPASSGTMVTLPAVTAITARRAVKVALSGSTLYLEYRPRTGRDASQPPSATGVQVRQVLTGSNESRMLIMDPATSNRMMTVGARWAVPGTSVTLTVEQIDAAGARIRVGNTYNDSTPPPAPAVPVVTAAGVAGGYASGSVTLRWPAVTDPESGIAEYRVLVDGQSKVVPATTPTLALGRLTGAVTVSVTAVNKAGLVGAASPGITVRGDNAPPTTPVFEAPTAGRSVGATTIVRWAAASDVDSGVAGYELLLDGRKVAVATAAATSADVTLPALTNGTHTLTLTAVDRVGNRSATAAVSINLARATLKAPTALKAAGDPAGSVVSWTAPPAPSVAGYDIFVDGVAKDTVAATPTSWRLANGPADGAHTVGVRARDPLGNVSPIVTVKAVLDSTAPGQPRVTAPLAGTVVKSNLARLSWTASTDAQSGISAYVIEVDHVEKARLAGSARTASVVVPDGTHHLTVAAVNGNGLRSVASDALGVTVTATPTAPAPPRITAPGARTSTNADSVTVTWTAVVDGGGLTGYEVLVDGQVAATVGATVTSAAVPLAAGTHTLAVRAVDPSGLASTSAIIPVTMDAASPTIGAVVTKLRTGSAAAGLPVTLTASATDASGVCALTATADGKTLGTAPAGTLTVTTTLPATTQNVLVTATDCAGNTATRTGPVSLASVEESAGTLTGTWTTASAAGYSGGAASSASTAGSALTWTFTGTHVAWIGSRTPTSGAAGVYLDGRKVATVDTRGTAGHRQVLWAGATNPGTHTVTVVVAGTSGRPAVLVDGFAAVS